MGRRICCQSALPGALTGTSVSCVQPPPKDAADAPVLTSPASAEAVVNADGAAESEAVKGKGKGKGVKGKGKGKGSPGAKGTGTKTACAASCACRVYVKHMRILVRRIR